MSATSGRPVYIERYEVLNIINDAIAHNALSYEGCTNEIVESIARIPAADVRPVVHGKWKKRKFSEDVYGAECSVCHTTWDYGTNFCPNCGADMRNADD